MKETETERPEKWKKMQKVWSPGIKWYKCFKEKGVINDGEYYSWTKQDVNIWSSHIEVTDDLEKGAPWSFGGERSVMDSEENGRTEIYDSSQRKRKKKGGS